MNMEQIPTLAITLFRRVDATRHILNALKACYGIKDYTVLLSVDIDPKDKRCWEVYDVAMDFRNTFANKETQVFLNHPGLGIDLNKISVLRKAYELTDTPIFLHDDNPPSPDALRWFEFGTEMYKDDPTIFQISGYNRITDRSADKIDPYAYSKRFGYGDGACWGSVMFKRVFEEAFG